MRTLSTCFFSEARASMARPKVFGDEVLLEFLHVDAVFHEVEQDSCSFDVIHEGHADDNVVLEDDFLVEILLGFVFDQDFVGGFFFRVR